MSLARMLLAVIGGLLLTWLGVITLIVLSVVFPDNRLPLALLAGWAVLITAAVVLPGPARPGRWREQSVLMTLLWLPLLPFARAAMMIWPVLPRRVQTFLAGRDGLVVP